MKKSVFFFATIGALAIVAVVGSYFYLCGDEATCTKSQTITLSNEALDNKKLPSTGSFLRASERSTVASKPVEKAVESSQKTLSVSKKKASHKEKSKEIDWINFSEMQKKVKEKPKKVFIDIYTDWCGWCKVLDKKTYTQSHIIEYLNTNYYSVKFNAEQTQNITFAGKEFKFIPSGRSGYHELAAALTEGRLSYPMLVFVDEELNPITYVAGFQEADELMDILVYLNEDHYKQKDTSFKDFKKKRAKKRTQ